MQLQQPAMPMHDAALTPVAGTQYCDKRLDAAAAADDGSMHSS
jgi:hypothetical protein